MSEIMSLIKAVRDYKCLYASDNEYYRSLPKRAAAWENISKKLGCDKRTCQARWKSLRDRYVRDYWKVKMGEHDVRSTWRWTPYLSFIEEYIQPRRQPRNLPSVEDLLPEQKIYISRNDDEFNTESSIKIEVDDNSQFIVDDSYDQSFDELDIQNEIIKDEEYSSSISSKNSVRDIKCGEPVPDLLSSQNCIKEKLKNLEQLFNPAKSEVYRKHEGFILMMDELLSGMPESEQRNSKMFILNYLYEKTKHTQGSN